MIVCIEKSTGNDSLFHAWTADNAHGVILGSGYTLIEAVKDLENSMSELSVPMPDAPELEAYYKNYFQEKRDYYVSVNPFEE